MSLQKLVGQFALAISFFSRVPLPEKITRHIDTNTTLASAVFFFPVAGFVIAIVPALVWFAANLVVSPLIAAGLAIACGLLITGALHEDGLADCVDGLGATHDREKALEIMRDSRVGTYGAIALIISIGLRWMLLADFAPLTGVLALVLCHSASRATITIAIQFADYARADGLGKSVDDGMPEFGFILTMAIAFVLGLALSGIWGIIAVAGSALTAWLMLLWLKSRLGGYTGDGLGAMQQIAEITILLVLSVYYGVS